MVSQSQSFAAAATAAGLLRGLIDDQVRDDARLCVDHDTTGLSIGGPQVCRAEHRRQHAREGRVRGTELSLINAQGFVENQIVVRAIDRPQTPGHLHIGRTFTRFEPSIPPLSAIRIWLRMNSRSRPNKRNHLCLQSLRHLPLAQARTLGALDLIAR